MVPVFRLIKTFFPIMTVLEKWYCISYVHAVGSTYALISFCEYILPYQCQCFMTFPHMKNIPQHFKFMKAFPWNTVLQYEQSIVFLTPRYIFLSVIITLISVHMLAKFSTPRTFFSFCAVLVYYLVNGSMGEHYTSLSKVLPLLHVNDPI